MKKYIFSIIILVIIFIGWYFLKNNGKGSGATPPVDQIATSTINDQTYLKNLSVSPNQGISSPLNMTGQARLWYFEASFPIQVLDANGIVLGSGIAQAQGDWMTENFVPFKATIIFATSTTETGTLVLKKDNPSGLEKYNAHISIPIKFLTVSKK